jgi:hypothetical protein
VCLFKWLTSCIYHELQLKLDQQRRNRNVPEPTILDRLPPRKTMSSAQVYKGVWTDWSKGAVLGKSLTVTDAMGNILLTIIATYISYVGMFLWRIIAFGLHQLLVKSSPTNAIRHQQQLAMRNSSDPLSAFIDVLSIWKAYQFNSRRSRLPNWFQRSRPQALGAVPPATNVKVRTGILITVSFVVWAGLIVAGIESSNIAINSYQSSDVLVKQGLCGFWSFSAPTSQASQAAADDQAHKTLNDTLAGRAYARACYAGDASFGGTISCNFFTKQSLIYTAQILKNKCPFGTKNSSDNLNLPFKNGECDVEYNTGAHFMDTGLLDSHVDLGINALADDRVKFRKVTTCSPITLANRTALAPPPYPGQNFNYTGYLFGPVGNSSNGDFTLTYNQYTIQDDVGYQIKSVFVILR